MSLYDWLWLAWALAFGAIEGTAIATKDWPGTLSDTLRRIFRTNTKRGRYVWAVIGGGFFAWFIVHIAVVGSL